MALPTTNASIGQAQMSNEQPLALFCTSLRKRSELGPIVPLLLQSTNPKWRESRFNWKHDLVVTSAHSEVYRYVILSAVDVGKPETEQRLDRLWHLNQGKHTAVIFFLLHEGKDCMHEYSQLQIDVMQSNLQLPILPLDKLDSLPTILAAFQQKIEPSQRIIRDRHQPTDGILRFCTTEPLRQHSLNVLSDITSCLAELAEKATSDEGVAEIREYLDGKEPEKVIQFFAANHAAKG